MFETIVQEDPYRRSTAPRNRTAKNNSVEESHSPPQEG